MCKYGSVVEKIFAGSVDNLARSNKKPPNREALRLYREVVKFCGEFTWRAKDGRVWRDVLHAQARKEFEDSKEERDPVILYKMMLTTREAVHKTREMVG